MKRAPSAHFETYPGLESFQDNESSRKLYFGRELEKQALLDLVVGEPLVVLFSRSGLGKSSLINAGLKQMLRERGYFPVSARVTLLKSPVESVLFAIRIEASLAGVVIKGGSDSSSLWQFLNSARFEREGRPCKLVLILDQFEELFTRVRETSPELERPFIDDLANVVRRRLPAEIQEAKTNELEATDGEIEAAKLRGGESNLDELTRKRNELVRLLYETPAPDVKVLIAIREDYLADLERLREPIPTVFHKMMRLDPLTREQARQSIEDPAARADIPGKEVFHFENDAIAQILQFLETRTAERPTSIAASIDPGQLQLICQNVDANRQGDLITAKELGGAKGMQRILQRFYRDTLRHIPKLRVGRNAQKWRVTMTNFILLNRARGAARRLCEHGLIARGRHRDSVMRETIHSRFGVIDDDLKVLEKKKLIRSTTRLQRDFFELSHDTLVKPVMSAVTERRSTYFAAAYLLVCTIPFIAHYGTDWNVARKNASLMAMVRSGQVDFSNKNLSGRSIRFVHWKGGSLVRASLRGAVFDTVLFDRVDLSTADVTHAKFDGSRFFRCKMSSFSGDSPSFVGSGIIATDLSRADIPSADFTHADLGDSKLINAVLDEARFIGTGLEHTNVTGISVRNADFTGTAWWTAAGWSQEQMRELSVKFPPENVPKSKPYQDDLTQFDLRLAAADRADQLIIYADRARYRAIRGAELGLAVADANRVLEIHRDDPAVLVTRAYVRLQQGDVAGAIADSEKGVEIGKKLKIDVGEDVYHLALAEVAAGKLTEAARHFQESLDLHYKPTYELVLTPRDNPLRRPTIPPRIQSAD